MHNVTTIGWLANRALTHDVAAQTVPASSTTATATEVLGNVLRWTNSIPSWAVLAMIILAASGVCCTVIFRSRAEFKTSSSQYQSMTSEIDSMRQANQSLQVVSPSRKPPNRAPLGDGKLHGREWNICRRSDMVSPLEKSACRSFAASSSRFLR